MRKLIGHVKSAHKNVKLASSYEDNPFEGGMLKVPCPKRCGDRFVLHQKSNHHAKGDNCPMPARTILRCEWLNCPFEASGTDAEHGMANHIRHKHSTDSRSPYQCFKCANYYHMNLYKLAMHEERCKPQSVATNEKVSLRFKLNKAAIDDVPPFFIIVNRSLNRAPEEWKAGTGDIKLGLPMVGKKILAHFADKSGHSSGAAVLHTSYECPTRRIPALAHDLSFLETQNHQKKMVWRGFKFIQAIVNDIEAANSAGIKPYLISQGLDAWACDVKMIMPWLRVNKRDFELVIKVNQLQYGMTATFAEKHGQAYWWHHDPEDILCVLENGPGRKPKVDELVEAWKSCQHSKDTQFGINVRRNFVNLNLSYPEVE